MLHNDVPCEPNDTPENLGALVTNVTVISSQNLADNLGKIAQQPMQGDSGRYYLPDFASCNHPSLNPSSQSSPQHSYSLMGIQPPFSSNNTQSIPDPSWQNNIIPPNMPSEAFHNPNMLNYSAQYDRNSENVQNQYTNNIRNIPQVPDKTIQKINYDPNCSNYNDSYTKNDNIVSDNNYSMTVSHEKPFLDNVKRKSLENTVRLIEDMLSNTAKSKETQRKQYINQILNNSSQNLQENFLSTLTSQHENLVNTTKFTQKDDNLDTSINQRDTLLTQQENITNSPEESINNSPTDENLKNETISKSVNFHEKSKNNLTTESYNDINSSKTNNGQNNSHNDSYTKNSNKESMQNSENENSTHIPFIKVEVEAYESENESQNSDISQNVEVKVESDLWPELEDMTIFKCDVNGRVSDEVGSANVFSGDESLAAAKEAIANATQDANTLYECQNCSLMFNHPKRYLIHHKWHTFGLTNERRMEMAKDRQMWRDQRKQARMVSKKIVKELNAPATWDCDQCDKQFPNKRGLKNHRERYHPTRTYECDTCKIKLLGYRAYKSHMLVHKVNKGPTHQCPTCNKKFVYAHTLKKHRGTHMEKTLQCPNCPKLFATSYHLNVHQKVHERAERGAIYRCSYCAKAFYETYNLNIHERTHRNEKPFKCDICHSAYGSTSSLKRHLRVSHSTSKPFECTVCHRCFATQSTRDRHEIREHGDPEKLQFACQLCDKRYMYQRDLTKHVYKTHKSGNRQRLSDSD